MAVKTIVVVVIVVLNVYKYSGWPKTKGSQWASSL